MIRMCFYLLLMVVSIGCNTSDPVSADSYGRPESKAGLEVEPIVLDSSFDLDSLTKGSYVIDQVLGVDTLAVDSQFVKLGTLQTDTLTLRVAYQGGCAEDKFRLIGEAGTFMESLPVQAGVVLVHESIDDACDNKLTRELRFDLSPLKQQYQALYGEDSGVMLLRFYLPSPERLLVEYRF